MIKFEKEIKNPIAFALLSSISIMIWLAAVLVAGIIAIISSPVWIPINYALKKNGRKGFLRIKSGTEREYHLIIDQTGFQKV